MGSDSAVHLDFDPGAAAQFDGLFGLPHTPEQAALVVIAVPWEPTTSYRRGTANGPRAILEASRQVDLFDIDTGKPYEAGIAILPFDAEIERWNAEACALSTPIIEAGGRVEGDPELQESLLKVNELSHALNERVYTLTKTQLNANKIACVLGGDHASPFGAIRAYAEKYPGLGVLHVDAHADLRSAYEGFLFSHASIMRNVAEQIPGVGRIVQVGIRDFSEDENNFIQGSNGRIVTFFDRDLAARSFEGEPFAKTAAAIVENLPQHVYISFDIDGLDPSLCPNTGTPVPGGLTFREAVFLLAQVAKSGRKIVGFDLNEVAPGKGGDEWDANVGARLLYKMAGFALQTRR
ncbi:MAG: agmatinase family protein [Polyangiaceae bacterium]|nr:agmatinase family protein [Polyangiaceae bacterium]